MARKPRTTRAAPLPKKPVGPQIDHDAVWQKILGDMGGTLVANNQQALNAAAAAEAALSALVDPQARDSAKKTLAALRSSVDSLEKDAAKAQLDVQASLRQALVKLDEQRQAALKKLKSAEQRRRTEELYAAKMLEQETYHQAKLREEFERFAKASTQLHEKTNKLVTDIGKQAEQARRDQVDQLDEVLSDLDALASSQRTEFEKAEEARQPKKKAKSRQEEIEAELKKLQAGFLSRKFIQPFTSSIRQSVEDKVENFKEKTGIARFLRYRESERERQARIRELAFERDQIVGIGAIKEKVLQQKKLLEAGTDQTERTERAVKSLSQITSNLASVMGKPLVTSSANDPVFDSPIAQPSARKEFAQIQERELVNREVRALERIARNIGEWKPEAGGNWLSKLPMLVAPLTAAALAALGGLGAVTIASRLGSLVTSLQTLAKAEWVTKLLSAVGNTVKAVMLSGLDKAGDAAKAAKAAGSNVVGSAARAAGGLLSKASAAVEGTYVGRGIEKVKSLASSGLSLASRAGQAVSGAMANAPASVTNTISAVSKAARTVGSAAISKAGQVGDTVRAAGSIVAKYAQMGSGRLVDVAKSAANSPVARYIGKNLTRLGNLATAVNVASGIYQEATGKTKDSITMVDAVLNPMDAGRFLGNKFNKLFESRMGTSFGNWVYDTLKGDEEKALLGSKVSGAPTVKANKLAVPADAPRAATPPTSGSSSPSSASKGKAVASISPTVSPEAIPNYLGVDPYMAALNLGALH